MPAFNRPALAALMISVAGLSACDELAVAGDPAALAELRGGKSCIAAVQRQTGKKGATVNTTIPVVELNQYIIDVPGAKSWNCFTDEKGKAVEMTEFRA